MGRGEFSGHRPLAGLWFLPLLACAVGAGTVTAAVPRGGLGALSGSPNQRLGLRRRAAFLLSRAKGSASSSAAAAAKAAASRSSGRAEESSRSFERLLGEAEEGTARATALANQTNTTNTTPVYAQALTELKAVEKAVENLTAHVDRLNRKVSEEEGLVRLVSENLTASRKLLYAAEWVVRQNKWTLGKNQVALADTNSSLGNENYKIKMTGSQTGDTANASTLLATKANMSANEANFTAIVNVEKALWNSLNPAGKTSIDKFEKRLTADEKTFKEFKAELGKKVRLVATSESRAELDKLRKAVFRLGKASSGVRKEDDDEDEEDDEEEQDGLDDGY